MAPALMILFLGCWPVVKSRVSGQLPAPRPSISVSPGGVIALGAAVTIRCRCRCEARRIFLYKGGSEIRELDPAGAGGEFTIPSAGLADGGVYSCRSCSRSEPPNWSSPSHTVRIIVGELRYPKPSISPHPSGRVALGEAVTVRCQAWYQNRKFLLYKDGNADVLRDMEPAGDLAEFPIRSVSRRDTGSYRCYYYHELYPFFWSYPSDPVQLVVVEPSYPKPTISLRPSGRVPPGVTVTVRCECRCRGVRVLLSKAGDPAARRSMDPAGDVAEFPIRNVSRGDAGSYSCRYSTKSNPPAWSEPSDPVELVVRGGTDPTQPGTTPAPTRPGSAGPGTGSGGRKSPSTPPGTGGSGTSAGSDLTLPIIAGVSAAAIGLLLLLAFVCYRRTHGRKGPVQGQSRDPDAEATVYALIGERKQADVPEPDPEGLTYAELDGRALQTKRGGPAPEPPQPSVYAAVNVTRGSGAPPTPVG